MGRAVLFSIHHSHYAMVWFEHDLTFPFPQLESRVYYDLNILLYNLYLQYFADQMSFLRSASRRLRRASVSWNGSLHQSTSKGQKTTVDRKVPVTKNCKIQTKRFKS